MTVSRSGGGNSSSVSMRKVHAQNVLSNTNEHEKAQSPALGVEALRTIGRVVRTIKARLAEADSGHRHAPGEVSGKSGSESASCQTSSPRNDQPTE